MPLAWSRNFFSQGTWPFRPPNGGFIKISHDGRQSCVRPSSLMVKHAFAGTKHLSRPGEATSISKTASIALGPKYSGGERQSEVAPMQGSCSAMVSAFGSCFVRFTKLRFSRLHEADAPARTPAVLVPR